MAKQNKPAIRFKGFTDAWEQRKLEDYLTVSAEKNTDNLYTKEDVLSVSGDFGVVNQIEFQGRSFAGASVSNYGVVHTGDVVYTKSPLKANPYGIIKANKGKPGIVSVLYGVYHTRENANADFIQMYFEQDARLNNYLRPLVNKGAKNTLLISDTDALEGEVCLAPTFDEQKAIGQFFDSLDNLITLHQRKYDKLQVLKKAMLEKMFPKNGSSVPEIRFKGFTDAWEQRKLGEVSESYSGGTPSVGVKEYYGGQIPFIRSAEINSEITELFLTEEGLKKSSARLVAMGDILYALYGATSGEVGRARLRGAINQAILAINPHTGYDSEYLAQWLRKSKHSIIETYLQGGQGNLSGTIVKELLVDFPSLKEQRAIGDFFSQLDHLITLHQRELEKLQNIKKSMLEKMFV